MSAENRKEQIDHEIAKALNALQTLSDKLAKEPNQWIAINETEMAVHKIRQTFEQELSKE